MGLYLKLCVRKNVFQKVSDNWNAENDTSSAFGAPGSLMLAVAVDLCELTIFSHLFLCQGTDIEIFSYKPTPLDSKTLEKIRPVLDYRCMVSGSEQKFLLGLGVSNEN